MLTKVYNAQNAFEQHLAILNLFYFQMCKKKYMFEQASLYFLAAGNKIDFRIT